MLGNVKQLVKQIFKYSSWYLKAKLPIDEETSSYILFKEEQCPLKQTL